MNRLIFVVMVVIVLCNCGCENKAIKELINKLIEERKHADLVLEVGWGGGKYTIYEKDKNEKESAIDYVINVS